MPLRPRSNGREAFVGSSCAASAPWLAKPAKMPNVRMLSRHAAGDREVALAEQQHLRALDQPRVARRARGADRVVRPGDPHVERDLARRVVRHRARVVVVRPDLRVVVELRDLVDLVLGLDVAVLGDADVDADARAVDRVPLDARSRPPPRGRSRCRRCRPACRGARPCGSGSAARRSGTRRRACRRRSGCGTSRRRCGPPAARRDTPAASRRWAPSGRRR